MLDGMNGQMKFILVALIIVPIIAILLTLKYHVQKPANGKPHSVGWGQYAMWFVLMVIGVALIFYYDRIDVYAGSIDFVAVILGVFYVVIFLMVAYTFKNFLSLLWEAVPLRNRYGDGPILSSHGLLESPMLGVAKDNLVEGYRCHFFANTKGRNIIFVELGRNTKLHIVAIGDKSQIASKVRVQTRGKSLTKVHLEGDFPKYMSMFCTPEYEVELLHLFDPTNMAYFADFCRAYDFEIYHDALYIAKAAESRDENDSTSMVDDVQEFLKRNKRWIDKVGASVHAN